MVRADSIEQFVLRKNKADKLGGKPIAALAQKANHRRSRRCVQVPIRRDFTHDPGNVCVGHGAQGCGGCCRLLALNDRGELGEKAEAHVILHPPNVGKRRGERTAAGEGVGEIHRDEPEAAFG